MSNATVILIATNTAATGGVRGLGVAILPATIYVIIAVYLEGNSRYFPREQLNLWLANDQRVCALPTVPISWSMW